MKYSIVSHENHSNITLFHDGEMYVANQEHPNWKAIVAGVLVDDVSVTDLFDVSKVVARKLSLTALSDRVSVANGRVYFDGDEVDNSLTRQILRFLDNDVQDWVPLVNFFEKVATNPNEHSREQLYRWLAERDFTITQEGDILAYKGVNVVQVDDDVKYLSVHSGNAFVDGVEVVGQIPNSIGSTITMPRSNVQFDSSVGCSTGLHAGTWDYASGFARGAVLEVLVDPRDVVSVPIDCNDQKLRVCRYEVLDITETVDSDPVRYYGNDAYDDYDDEEEDYDDDCSADCQDCYGF